MSTLTFVSGRFPIQPEPDADSSPSAPGGGIIDMDTFHQILDLDDEDGTHEFSAGMVWAYFDQAASTFKDMTEALYVISCPSLSSQF